MSAKCTAHWPKTREVCERRENSTSTLSRYRRLPGEGPSPGMWACLAWGGCRLGGAWARLAWGGCRLGGAWARLVWGGCKTGGAWARRNAGLNGGAALEAGA